MTDSIKTIQAKQRAFFQSGQSKALSFRKTSLKALKTAINQREKDIYVALKQDLGKSEFESYISEFSVVMADIDQALSQLKHWSRPKRVTGSLLNFPSKDFIYKAPYGLTLHISPWNYPFQLALAPLVAAVAAGNCVVLKPSEHSPNTSQLVENLISEVFNPGHVTVVQGDAQTAKTLLELRWDYIFFTGSVAVGKIVAKAAAEYLTPVTLELGGKNPCIIDSSAALGLAAKRIVWGKFLNAGQTCIAPDYLLVHNTIYEPLIALLIKEINAAFGNDPLQSPDYGRLIHRKHLDRQLALLDGETVICGGTYDLETNSLAPTLVEKPTMDSPVMKDEIFGPILPILTYDIFADIEHCLDQYAKPLGFYVFSKNKPFIEELIERFGFGGGCVNDTMMQFVNSSLPFGGVGESGIGAYHGQFGFDTFSHQKAVSHRANWLDAPLRYAPYKNKLTQAKWVERLRAIFK